MQTSEKSIERQPTKMIELEKMLKIRIRNPHTKKLNTYRTWRNLNTSGQKIPNFINNPKSPGLIKLINTFFIDKKHHDHYADQFSLKIPLQKQQASNSCRVMVDSIERSIELTTCKNLIKSLSNNKKQVITYSTFGKNIILDYCLTKLDFNISFFNGSSIHLVPVYKKQQKHITLKSFQVLKCIGTGGFSKVFLCRFLEDGQFYAMKVINKDFIIKNRKKKIVMNQRNIMKQLKHPFIINMKFAFESRQSLIFILQFCPGGELFNLVKKHKRIKQSIARFYMIEILLGLQEIHQSNIVYRDFKPQNILIDMNGHIRIADFGLAKPSMIKPNHRAMSFCGSPQYMPPEMIMKTGHSYPVDFYCLGALLYELVTGLPPFYSKDPNKIYDSTMCQPISFPKHTVLSAQIKQLLLGLLHKDQKYRIGSLMGVKEILAHPWFGKIDKKAYLQKQVKSPCTFSSIEDLNFSFDETQEEGQGFLLQIKRQQKYSNKSFTKVMTDFYYDYRNPNGMEPQAIQKPNNQLVKYFSKKNKQNSSILYQKRSKTSNSKFRNPLSQERFNRNFNIL